jgi:hypothetical protein
VLGISQYLLRVLLVNGVGVGDGIIRSVGWGHGEGGMGGCYWLVGWGRGWGLRVEGDGGVGSEGGGCEGGQSLVSLSSSICW